MTVDRIIAAGIFGLGLSAIIYAFAFAVVQASKSSGPEESGHVRRKVTRLLIYFCSTGMIATAAMILLWIAAIAIGSGTSGNPLFEVNDCPFAAIPLGLALAPVLSPMITSWARNWLLSWVPLAFAATLTTLMISMPTGGHL